MKENKNDFATLYIVSTPIGNLGDITYRAVETLKAANYIAVEDTRKSRILLNHYEINGKKLVSYYGPKEREKAGQLLKILLTGESVALITDAGTPGISDPAGKIVTLAIENDIAISPIPGASALLSALPLSGFDTSSFIFEGFLPIKKGKRLAKIKSLCQEERRVVLYESTHRILKLISELEEEVPERNIVVAKELTKIHENFFRGKPAEVKEMLVGKKSKGEFVVIINGFKRKI